MEGVFGTGKQTGTTTVVSFCQNGDGSRGGERGNTGRVATVREKYLENAFISRSGKSQGILWMARESWKGLGKSGKSQGI